MTPASASRDSRTVPGRASAGTAAGGAGASLTATARAFLKQRGLSESILAQMPVAFGTDRGRECMFFGCVVDGVSKGYKARPLDFPRDEADIVKYWQKKGTPQRLWNLDQVRGSKRVWITEGEIDACALVEAGISPKEVVSVPNGAKDNEEKITFEQAVESNLNMAKQALEDLQGAELIVLCVDGDRPGLALRQALATVLGAARCRFHDWPEGVKDADEMLVKEGPDALYSLVTDGTLPWPVDGLFRMSEMPEPPRLELWDAGWPEWEGGVKLAPTHLSVVTGHGGHGKSRFTAQMWAQIANGHGVRIAVCTMETLAKPGYRRYLRESIIGRDQGAMSDTELRKADAWIEDHYRFIQHPKRSPGLQWLLDVAEVAVVREGCRALVIDPWNKLERTRADRQSETDYIGQVLDEMMVFATDLNCHVQIIAHPAKSDASTRGKPPELEHIAGSKAWETKPDQGFVMYRPELFKGGTRMTGCEFYVKKTRFEELGFPRRFDMRLDLATGRYVSMDYENDYTRAMKGAA